MYEWKEDLFCLSAYFLRNYKRLTSLNEIGSNMNIIGAYLDWCDFDGAK